MTFKPNIYSTHLREKRVSKKIPQIFSWLVFQNLGKDKRRKSDKIWSPRSKTEQECEKFYVKKIIGEQTHYF